MFYCLNLIISAQAFHWLRPDIRYKKVHNLLTEDGSLALFSNFQEIDMSETERGVYGLYRKYCINYPKVYGSSMHKIKEDLRATIIINPKVELHEPGSLPVFELKAKRVVDSRPKI